MEVFTLLLTTTIVCVLAYIYTIWKTLKTFESAGIPYVSGLPILGNMAPSLFRKIQIGELHQKFYRMFPDAKYFGMFDCTTPVIFLKDPELIKQIAIKHFDNFTDHMGFATSEDKVFSNALFALKGDRWRGMRGLLSPSFTSSKLKQMFELISKCAKSFANSLEVNVDKGMTKFEMKSFAGRYTNDIICKYAFGIEVDSVKDPTNVIYETGQKMFAFDGPLSTRFLLLRNFPLFSKIFGIPVFTKTDTDFFTSIIKSTIAEKDKHNVATIDMLQVMLNTSRNADSKVKVDFEDIISETFIFFFGGYDTTSSYLSSTLHLLATHPDVQERLLAEIDEVYENTNGNPSYDDIQSMSYIDCVLNEVGRMYPPVPYLDRRTLDSFELPPPMPGCPPFTLKPGSIVYFPVYSLQHDAQYFPDPDKFDPDRFHNNKSVNSDCGYYMPFGIGRRICIGARLAMLDMKLLLFHMLSRVSFKPSDNTVVPMKFATNSFMMMSHNKVWLNVEKRNKH